MRSLLAVFRVMQLARLHDPGIATNAPGKLGQARIEFVDVAIGPARDLPIRADTELLEHSFKHRSDSDDQLQIVR